MHWTGTEQSIRRRLLLKEVDPSIMMSWDFDVFYYTHEQLIAHVCVMFIRLGLTDQAALSLVDTGRFDNMKSSRRGSECSDRGGGTAYQSLNDDLQGPPAPINPAGLVDVDTLWTFIEEVSSQKKHGILTWYSGLMPWVLLMKTGEELTVLKSTGHMWLLGTCNKFRKFIHPF